MGRTISVFAGDLRFFGDSEHLQINGAQLLTAEVLRRLAAQPWLDALEVFIPPSEMVQEEKLAQVAYNFLPRERRGQGVLRFYPFYALPEVWSDGAPRAVLCFEAESLVAQRYLRDRYATGPTPITTVVHTHAHHSFWKALDDLSRAPHVQFDSFVLNSDTALNVMRRGFAWLADVSKQNASAPTTRLERIGFGVDLDLLRPHSNKARTDARRVLGLPQDGRIVLYFGRVTPHSKADLMPLLRCFAEASDDARHYLLLVGSPSPQSYLQKLREAGDALGLADRLVIHGEVGPQLPAAYYGAADFFVFPSDNPQETWGQTMLEAMASGLPVIASDWDGLPVHVEHEKNGFLIPTWWMPGTQRLEAFSPLATTERLAYAQNVWIDTVALTNALHTLLHDEERVREMGHRSRRMAEERYQWHAVMEKWRALWDELEEAARSETPEQAQQRRAYAEQVGLPVPFQHLFSDYASGVIDAERHCVRLTPRALNLLARQESLGFYDDVVPMLRREIVENLFLILRDSEQPMRISQATQLCAAQTGADDDLIRFHLGLFLKNALVELSCAP